MSKDFQRDEEEALLLDKQRDVSNAPLVVVQKALEEVTALHEDGVISEEEQKRRTQFITCASFDARDSPNILLYDSDDDKNNDSAYLPYLEILNVASACCRRAYRVLMCGCCTKEKRKPRIKRWDKGVESEL